MRFFFFVATSLTISWLCVQNGYWIDDSPIMYKQMIMQAFPPLLPENQTEFNLENFEQGAINYIRVLNKYLDEDKLSPASKALAGSVVK